MPPSEEEAPEVEWPPPRVARSMEYFWQKRRVVEMSVAEVASMMAPCGCCQSHCCEVLLMLIRTACFSAESAHLFTFSA